MVCVWKRIVSTSKTKNKKMFVDSAGSKGSPGSCRSRCWKDWRSEPSASGRREAEAPRPWRRSGQPRGCPAWRGGPWRMAGPNPCTRSYIPRDPTALITAQQQQHFSSGVPTKRQGILFVTGSLLRYYGNLVLFHPHLLQGSEASSLS